ncbi:MAG: PKD domain-containing protein [Tessaracoccus sp.]|uniref:PKD domain-containing protein n=1 Tax=Tessaracoccus sp. TaxID=1971211 RepID=UPI001EB933D5|nr:PKD domain-containing protein [Tessaracoccus sp.]MBK7822196.1 PKD domain-containing protein [Tessaracoccus sp.]
MFLKRVLAVFATASLIVGGGILSAPTAAAAENPTKGPDGLVRDGSTSELAAASCFEIKQNNPDAPDGAYWLLTPKLQTPQQFFCDQTTDGGGWVLVGKGRNDWQSYYHGQGEPSALLTRNRTPSGFSTVQLSSNTIDGLLDGRNVKDLGNAVRIVRARNDTGTQWQNVRFAMPNRDRWSWAFGATHPITMASFDGSGSGTGTSTSFGTNSNWNRVLFEFSSRQGWRAGFGYGTGAAGGSSSDTSFLYSITGNGSLPYAELYVRPTLVSTDLHFPAIPDTGTSAIAQRAMASSWAARTPWGVTGNLNGRVAEGNQPAQAFAQIGNVVYVGGNYTTVQRGSSPGSNVAPRAGLAAFNATTGEFISSFSATFNNQVKALVALPNGKLLAGGEFTTVNGEPALGTALLDPATGARDTSWDLSIENRLTSGVMMVRSLSLAGDYVYLGGAFTHLSGGGANNVYARHGARVNWTTGQPDRTFNPAFDGTVVSVDASDDGSRYYAAGYFTMTAGGAANKAAAIQAVAGAPLVAPWNTVWSNGDRSGYQQAILDAGPRVYVGGSEHSIFGYDPATLARRSGSITLGSGGDFQALAEGSGVVYGGCHCGSWSYQDAYLWPTPAAGWTQADKIQFVGAWDAETGDYIPSFSPPFLNSSNAGAWGLFVGNDGALWAGGDFTGSRISQTSSQWNGGFVKFDATDSTPPGVPGNLRVASTTASSVTLAWNSVAGAASYQVLRDDRAVGISTTTSLQVPLNGAQRYFVRAVDAAGNLGASTPVLVVPGGKQLPNSAFTIESDGLDVTLVSSPENDSPTTVRAWTLGDGTTASTPTVTHRYLGGGTYDIELYVTDATGAWSRTRQTVTLEQPVPADPYGAAVYNRAPWAYWRLDEAAGAAAADGSGNANHAIYREGVIQGASGVLRGNAGARFDGVNDVVVASRQIPAPQVYSTEAWFKTTTTQGGKIIGFGASATGLSSSYDRHVFMRNDGRLVYGIYNGGYHTITSTNAYNDGSWHHVVASQSASGLVLYVDGVAVGTNPQAIAETNTGYWRVGGDRVWEGASSSYFDGSIDEVAIYSTPLTSDEVENHFLLGTPGPNVAPKPAFTHNVTGRTVAFDASSSSDEDGSITSFVWDFGDGTTGTGVSATHTYATEGVYAVALRVTDDAAANTVKVRYVEVGATVEPPADAYGRAVFDDAPNLYWQFEETSGTNAADSGTGLRPGTYQQGTILGADGIRLQNAAQFDGVDDVVVANASVPGPSIYSAEVWFRTATTSGGKLIGFGNASSGTSNNYDRHVYMRDDGRLVFGVWVNEAHTVTSSDAYNDGEWHHLVATQSDAGMILYVDGVSVGTNPQKSAQPYSGYWRVGGDSVWDGSSSAYFSGLLDEAAVYSYALSPEQVAGHYGIGILTPNRAPVASFTYEADYLDVEFDASGSSDPDGSIASVSWDFGDDSAAVTGEKVSHTYAAAGEYQVTVTVTDDEVLLVSRLSR